MAFSFRRAYGWVLLALKFTWSSRYLQPDQRCWGWHSFSVEHRIASFDESKYRSFPIYQNIELSILQNIKIPIYQYIELLISRNIELSIYRNIGVPIFQNIVFCPPPSPYVYTSKHFLVFCVLTHLCAKASICVYILYVRTYQVSNKCRNRFDSFCWVSVSYRIRFARPISRNATNEGREASETCLLPSSFQP